MPAFGSLVCIPEKDRSVWGIVSNITTGSSDPQRIPFAYQKTEDELRAEQPQIFEFLTTTFQVCVVGYQHGAEYHYTLPAQPVKIHRFVGAATLEEKTRFFSSPRFFPLLFTKTTDGPALDELILAVCQTVAQSGILNAQLFEKYYQTFSLLVGNDYRRLKLLLSRISAEHASSLISAPSARST